MKISLDRLSTTPERMEFEADPAWWSGALPAAGGLPREVAETFRLVLEAYRAHGEDVILQGRVEGTPLLECSRCLARYRHSLREPFRLVLEPAGDRVPADPDQAEALSRRGVCLGDELETGWFRGFEIDLGTYFREVVSLTLPVQPLCREDCPGLCPRCGAERSAGPCGCVEARADSPFAVLATLREGRSGGGN